MSWNPEVIGEHSSYGLLQFSRFSGKSNFFDVEPTLDGGISLNIHTAEVHRDLNRNWMCPDRNILRARLSSHQFAEAITSLNIGSGVPITLEYVNGMEIDRYEPLVSQRNLFDSEVKTTVIDAKKALKNLAQDVEEIKNKSRVTKKDIEDIQSKISGLYQVFDNTLPYIEKSFQNVLDKQTIKSKVEFTTWLDQRARELGLQYLQNEHGGVQLLNP